jgi:macrolide-specific efflux system membrane fusion protein
MRWFIMLAIAAAMFGLVYLIDGQWRLAPPQASEENAPSSAAAQQVFAAGAVEGEYDEIVLKFELPGRVRRVLVTSGTQVKAGQLLAEIDSVGQDLHVQEARAQWELASAERDLLLAGRHLTGTRWRAAATPAPAGATPPLAPAQVSEEEIKVADARIHIAEAALNYQRLLLNNTRLVAPVDGEIVHCELSAGDLVGPTDISQQLVLAPRGRTLVRAFVEELDALDVQAGQQAKVVVPARRDHIYRGVVSFCAPELRPKSLRHNLPGERFDIRVREVTIVLDETVSLLRGLPVEVFLARRVDKADAASTAVTPGSAVRSERE